MAAKKTASNKTAAGKRSNKGKGKVEKVMHEYKHHELRSGGRRKVTNPKQAIAIALSEAREAGADIPPRKRSAKKSGGKTAGGRKSTAKKSMARKSTAKKSAGKKSASKKSSGKKTARKSAARR